MAAWNKEMLYQLHKDSEQEAHKEGIPDGVVFKLQKRELLGESYDHQEDQDAEQEGVGKGVEGYKAPPDRYLGQGRRRQQCC